MSRPAYLLDTHLLLLLVVGMTSRRYISMHKRLQAYDESDFDLLVGILSSASELILTPNTLTETSNLAAYIAEPAKGQIFESFRNALSLCKEEYVASKLACGRDEFFRLGLTDCVLLEATTSDCLLLTADLDLYLAVMARGGAALNFNHLRESME